MSESICQWENPKNIGQFLFTYGTLIVNKARIFDWTWHEIVIYHCVICDCETGDDWNKKTIIFTQSKIKIC